jgi:hypothetical protein
MELTLYTHNNALDYVQLFDFTTEELDEISYLAENAIKDLPKKIDRLTKQSIINQLIAANFAYNENDQTITNKLIFKIVSPNKLQPEDIECIVFYKECENNIEVINISAYFG